MLSLTPNIDRHSNQAIYVQLYEYIVREIMNQHFEANEKLPSVRVLSSSLHLSKTTIETAYSQLLIEGYIYSKPQSGYYVNKIDRSSFSDNVELLPQELENTDSDFTKYDLQSDFIDENSFDFISWKKCVNHILLDYSKLLLTEGLPEGEYELRRELCKYVRHSRGVRCTPDQIVIGAGVQSLLNILCIVLKNNNYTVSAFEDPGFHQARHIFKNNNFKIFPIALDEDGVDIELLSKSDAQTCYISPSHQFPMGTIMSINKRFQLLNWAYQNDSLIIEDDYDSELRYIGRPIPALQGLDEGNHVIYLGSFSTTLLPSIRISYMILPQKLLKEYNKIKTDYSQTASKIEQLTLALFMKEGLFAKHIRKLRNFYAKKNALLVSTIEKIMSEKVNILQQGSGIYILLEVKTKYTAKQIATLSEKAGVKVASVSEYTVNKKPRKHPLILLSYSGIPTESIEPAIRLLNEIWFGGADIN